MSRSSARAGNISDEGLTLADFVFVPSARVSERQFLRRNDVLVAASSGSLDVVGKAALVTSNPGAAFGAFCKVLRPREKVHPGYFAHFFKTPAYRSRVSALAAVGANINNLRNQDLDDLTLPLPSFTEQLRIAEILDRAEGLRAKRRAALAQVDRLTQAIFLELFGDPLRNEMGSPCRALKDLGRVSTGRTPSSALPDAFGVGVPFVTPGDLESNLPAKRSLSPTGAAASVTVGPDAALVCCMGATIGKMKRSTERTAFNQQINAVEWHPDLDGRWGIGCLSFFRSRIAGLGASTTLPILKKSSFERLEVPVPPPDLQREFAHRAAAVDRLKASHRASLAQLDALFASLQHRAFRGEL